MNLVDLIVPDISEEIDQLLVSCWHFEEGDRIEDGMDVVELSAEKATFNVNSNVTGILKEVFFEEGDVVAPGDILATIEEEDIV